MNVDAIVLGSVTEFAPYYPPRLGLSVQWFAANPGFHPIPPGYGLPWGTSEEEFIPDSLVFEAEFALAKEQLATQTPEMVDGSTSVTNTMHLDVDAVGNAPSAGSAPSSSVSEGDTVDDAEASCPLEFPPAEEPAISSLSSQSGTSESGEMVPDLPIDWPDPRGFVPPPPGPARPPYLAQEKPVMRHTRLYHGDDADFTKRLANYFYFRDDARFGGWQAYLQRSDDFIRFCCYLHITEMLAARGGAGETRVVWRWPIGRYER
jgi:hypothetical protein